MSRCAVVPTLPTKQWPGETFNKKCFSEVGELKSRMTFCRKAACPGSAHGASNIPPATSLHTADGCRTALDSWWGEMRGCIAGHPAPKLSYHLDVRQSHNPCAQLPGEAQGIKDDESRIPKPLQRRGAHARDAQGVERVPEQVRRPTVATAPMAAATAKRDGPEQRTSVKKFETEKISNVQC